MSDERNWRRKIYTVFKFLEDAVADVGTELVLSFYPWV